MDIDETILDNTREEGTLIANDRRKFDPAIWNDWVKKKASPAFEGAKDFLTYATSRGVTVFYVTNRTDMSGITDVISNLTGAGFPVPSPDVVLVTGSAGTTGTDKESRRQFVAASYRVLLMIGDDLADFFSTTGMDAPTRIANTLTKRDLWGWQWIVIPNPAYGSWERSFYTSTDSDQVILKKKRDSLSCINSPCP